VRRPWPTRRCHVRKKEILSVRYKVMFYVSTAVVTKPEAHATSEACIYLNVNFKQK
jgi:hypothetical protein